MNTIFCSKLKKNSEALANPPFPGELGKRIIEHVSKEAWHLWLLEQTKIINENRLNPLDKSCKEMLKESMLKFLSLN